MTKDEALKLALEALEDNLQVMEADWTRIDEEWGPSEGGLQAAIAGTLTGYGYFKDTISAIAAIREVLAQPEQEPVAWRYNGKLHEFDPSDWATGPVTPLYTAPPPAKPWVGLTDEEIEQVCVPLGAAMLSFTEVARAIEAKLKEKNA